MHEPRQPDRIGAALWSLLAGATAGSAGVAGALVIWRLTSVTVLPPDALLAILAGGVVLGSVLAWRLSRPVGETWRRGVVATLAAFGVVLLALGTVVVDLMGQALGLTIYGTVLAGVALSAALRARRTAAA